MSRSRRPHLVSAIPPPPEKKELLQIMGRAGFAPASLRELLRRLKVDKRHRMTFKRLVRDLV